MKKRSNYIYLIIISSILGLLSCSHGQNEGRIKYNIEFNEKEKEEREIISMLPETMNYYFKDKSSVSEISFMGMFKTAYISNATTKTNSVIFHFIDHNYSSTTPFGEKTLGFDPMPGIILEKTSDSKMIDSLEAYRVHVRFENPSIEEYDIWYTKDIKVKDPNWHTPYKEIDGILLDYRIKMKGISMHLTYDSFDNTAVDSSKFEVPKSYKVVTPAQMDSVFDSQLNMKF